MSRRLFPYEIRSGRLVQGLTQRSLGGVVGVQQPAVSRWETGKRHPRPDNEARLQIVLMVPLPVVPFQARGPYKPRQLHIPEVETLEHPLFASDVEAPRPGPIQGVPRLPAPLPERATSSKPALPAPKPKARVAEGTKTKKAATKPGCSASNPLSKKKCVYYATHIKDGGYHGDGNSFWPVTDRAIAAPKEATPSRPPIDVGDETADAGPLPEDRSIATLQQSIADAHARGDLSMVDEFERRIAKLSDQARALRNPCPTCKAKPRRWCTGVATGGLHKERFAAAATPPTPTTSAAEKRRSKEDSKRAVAAVAEQARQHKQAKGDVCRTKVRAHPYTPARECESYDQVCYPVKGQAVRAFIDRNLEVTERAGGAEQIVATGGEFDVINEKYGRKGRRKIKSLGEAVGAVLPTQRPYCLDKIDLETLNETSPAREYGPFELPDLVLEDRYSKQYDEWAREQQDVAYVDVLTDEAGNIVTDDDGNVYVAVDDEGRLPF